MIYEDDNVGRRITVVDVDWEEEQDTWTNWFRADSVCHFYSPWHNTLVTGGMTVSMINYYYTTDWTASLSRTINGRTSSAQWIVGVPPDRRSMNFGYVLFPGTGDSMELRSG